MTDTNARPSAGDGAQGEADRPQEGAEVQAPGAAEEERIAALVQTLTRESADYKDKLLRTLADMENLRRRTEREIADTRAYGIQSFARDILAVADNMERALGALDAELREKADASTKALLDGVELTERELLKVLEKHGVKKFDPLGEKFDPNLHQAMFEVPDASRPNGTVAQVMQPGYMIGDRMLRPALVGIAKGGPKPSAEQPANDNADSPEPQQQGST
ncbi:MAG: nucleotide exchange factor GrpE [Xanthobacteraceae bacterium]